jgi:hypothetical protein
MPGTIQKVERSIPEVIEGRKLSNPQRVRTFEADLAQVATSKGSCQEVAHRITVDVQEVTYW